MAKKTTVRWLNKPQKHDYAAAESFLSLVMAPESARKAVDELQGAAMSQYAAKDIFRASSLPLLGLGNSHVDNDCLKILRNEKLSPILLFRDVRTGRLVIADGYHRLCAVYSFDEDALIPCKIA